MSKYYYDIEQNTDEWFQVKLGHFGASTAAELLMKSSTAGYNNLINRIVFERIVGNRPESFSNEWMERGIELEAEALKAYELMTFNKTQRVGYVELDKWIGCSPDSLIDDDGLIQVKCPKYSTHIDYILSDNIPSNYQKQMQFEMMVTERKYNIFFSYHPDLKPFIKIVYRDPEIIELIEKALCSAKQLVSERIQKYKKN
ncbi:MAG: YqaJ viral recombinase family protein [Bacteroidetes bacterium]|nr:YqaJ viral recombinase family protein [Bacteroidota bacterium]